MTRPPITILLLVAAGALMLGAFSTPIASYTLQPEASSMRVEGTSTLHDWECPMKSMEGSFQIDPTPTDALPIADLSRVTVNVPVEQIDCDNNTMNSKLRDALQAEAYPTVIYMLESVDLQPLPDSSDAWFEAQTTGQLIIAGSRNEIEMPVKGQRMDDGRIRFVGQHAFTLSSFDIDRPSAMLGAIKTGDEVTVHFDVVVAR